MRLGLDKRWLARVVTRFLALALTGVTACGTAESEGFLSDATTCEPNDAAADQDATDYAAAAPVAIRGTSGLRARVAQRQARLYADTTYWGARLLLVAPVGAGDGLAVGLHAGYDVIPDGSETSQAGGIIPAASIPATADWVTVAFKEPVTVAANFAYWLQIAPLYAVDDVRQAAWLTTSGTNFATYDHETMLWSVNGALQGAMRLVPCK